jgi:hypothetical protein
MSFNTGGHIVYLSEPKKASAPHAIAEANGVVMVFTDVPSDVDISDATEKLGTIFPETTVRGRIVG